MPPDVYSLRRRLSEGAMVIVVIGNPFNLYIGNPDICGNLGCIIRLSHSYYPTALIWVVLRGRLMRTIF